MGQSSKYSIRPRTTNPCIIRYFMQYLEFMTTVITNPGPGAYESKPTLNDKGSYFISKFKNSMASTISPSKN